MSVLVEDVLDVDGGPGGAQGVQGAPLLLGGPPGAPVADDRGGGVEGGWSRRREVLVGLPGDGGADALEQDLLYMSVILIL